MLGLGFAATISSQCAKPTVMLGGDKRLGTTDLLSVFAENNGLQTIQTPVDFKYSGEEVLDAPEAKNIFEKLNAVFTEIMQ